MYQKFFTASNQRPWNSRTFSLPKWHKNYPTMLTKEEMHMLAWFSANTPIKGAIVDLGAFLGGSTISLAHGSRQSNLANKIHSYDRFQIDEKLKFQFLYKKGHNFVQGENALPIFETFTKTYSDLIKPYQGDILNSKWDKKTPISILFIDLSKTMFINDHLIREFFPALVPGSIVVQQDFLFFRNPWLYPTMKSLSNSIELLSYTDEHSVIFGVNKTPTQHELESCLSENLSPSKTIDAIKFYRAKFTDMRQTEMIDALLEVFMKNPQASKAWEFSNPSHIKYSFEDSE